MKYGMTLAELASELTRQRTTRKDFVADTRHVAVETGESGTYLRIQGVDDEAFALQQRAGHQIAARYDIPRKYADRIRGELPALYDQTINQHLTLRGERRLIRTLDGTARAFLSDRYRRLDNVDLMEAIYPELEALGDGVVIETCALEDWGHLYLKGYVPGIQAEVEVGDIVYGGFCITNSEVGDGRLRVEPLMYRLVCKNGMISPVGGIARSHLGARLEESDEAYALYTDETLAADDRAFWLKARDSVRAVVNEIQFALLVDQVRALRDLKLESPIAAVTLLGETYGLGEGEQGSVLTRLVAGADNSMYGLVNAVTNVAQSAETHQRSTELERIGGSITALPRTKQVELARAA